MSNEVEIIVRGKDQSGPAMQSATRATQGYKKGLDATGEAADKSETRVMGMKDSVDGLATVMKGPGEQGLASYLQGWADLASGIANFVIPAMQAFTITNIKSAASTVATKVAAIATATATKAWAAAQWLLNVALTANPIGIVVMAVAALVGALILAYNKSETFRAGVQAVNEKIAELAKWLWDKLVIAFKVTVEWIQKAWGWFKNLIGATDSASDAADAHEKAQKRQKEAAEKATEELKRQKEAADKLADSLLGLEGGQLDFEGALDSATKSLKENGRTLDAGTEKGRNNRRALQDIARSTMAWRKAAEDAGESQEFQTQVTEQGRAALIRAAKQMGATDKEAREYARGLLGIPKVRQTEVKISTKGLGVVIGALNRAARDRVVTFYTRTVGGGPNSRQPIRARRSGGIIGAAASGGVRSNMTLVGEDGPELADLPPGTRVHSAPDTNRMLARSGGGGVARVEIEWVGGNAGDEFMTWLKKNIRVRGGRGSNSVQTALGS